MTVKVPPPICTGTGAATWTTVSSGLTSRETSLKGRDTGTASAMAGKRAKRSGSTAPGLPVMPIATRVAPGILFGVKPSSRMRAQTASMSSAVASAFMRMSIR
jgi:hypothetical protein